MQLLNYLFTNLLNKEGDFLDSQQKKELIAAYKQRKVTGGVFAIKNERNGKSLLCGELNLTACKNRFDFSVMTNSCVFYALQKDWATHGAKAFTFTVLEEIEQGETQTNKAFREDLDTLLEYYRQQYDPALLY